MVSRFGATALLALFTLLLRAQTPIQEVSIHTHAYAPPSTVLHAESNLVETGLTVRDSLGRAIGGLRASDFQVLDNGVAQQITAFTELRRDATVEAPAAEPKSVTFCFDDLHTGPYDMPFAKQAARVFAAKYMRAGDRMSLVTTSGIGGVDFTGDGKLFAEKAGRLMPRVHMVHSIEEYQADSEGTLSALRIAAERLSQAPGKRILVWLSSGFIIHVGNEHDVQSDVDRLVDAAVRWNVVIHAIDTKGVSIRRTLSSNRPLREITQGTGGHIFENTNDFAGSMELAANPDVTYQIAFNPGSPDGKFHRLKIRFQSKRGDAVEYRPGYLSRPGDSEKAVSARASFDQAVFSGQTLSNIPVTVALAPEQPKQGTKAGEIPVFFGITVDVNRLQFAVVNGRHVQQIAFLMALLDANGGFVTGKESIMDLALTDAKLASLGKDGLKTAATLDAPPGVYRLRTVVREGMKGALSASTTPVELHAK